VLVEELDVAGTLARRGEQERALDGVADLDGSADGSNVSRSVDVVAPSGAPPRSI
jgi:hypothetical protein